MVGSVIRNITQIDCFDDGGLCIAVGNGFAQSFLVKSKKLGNPLAFQKPEKNSSNSNSTDNAAYSLEIGRTFFRAQLELSQNTPFKFAVVSVIPGTNFFLEGTSAGEGIARWNIGTGKYFTRVSHDQVPDEVSYSCLKAANGKEFAIGTFSGWKSLFVLDFLRMKILRVFRDVWGFADYLTKDPIRDKLVLAQENIIAVFCHYEGMYLKSITSEYYLNAIKPIPLSSFVVVAGGKFVRVYNTDDSDYYSREDYILSYKMEGNVNSI